MQTMLVIFRTSISVPFLALVLIACATPQKLSAAATPDKCSNHTEWMAVGEVLSLAIGCKQAFPDLVNQVDQAIEPLKNKYPGCFAEYDRPGPARDQLQTAIGMGAPQLKQNKEQLCVTDLRNGVKNTQTLLNK